MTAPRVTVSVIFDITAETAELREVKTENQEAARILDELGYHGLAAAVRRSERAPAPRDEYAQQMAGGGMHIRNPDPAIERHWPLDEWIPAMRRHGGHVYRRRIVVLAEWYEVGDDGLSILPVTRAQPQDHRTPEPPVPVWRPRHAPD